MQHSPLQILLVDDSAVVRGLLTKALEADPQIVVAATAMRGDLALTKLAKHTVDAVILDVEMPVMDGLATLQEIRQLYPDLPVIMFSSQTQSGAVATVKALALGAAECVAKPVSNGEALKATTEQLSTLLKAICRRSRGTKSQHPVARATHETTRTQPAAAATSRPFAGSRRANSRNVKLPPKMLVIGSSTGGPAALTQTLKNLPRTFPIPTVIVQHMPATFTPLLAKHLQQDTGRPCAEVTRETIAMPGHTYVAPGGFHVTVHARGKELVLKTNEDPAEHFCRPSVNPLFRTAAKACGDRLLAVMLTGMGSDGLEGTGDIVQAGGRVIAQDEASSVVWGMPGAIVNADLAHEILPLTEIGTAISQHCTREACLV